MKIFIPIKNNSQRVPRKNFRLLNDKPLYKVLLDKLIGYDVYIDTDSEEIIQGVEQYKNVTVYRRSKKLIGDTVSVCDLLECFIKKFDIKEPVCQVHVTSPFITSEIIKEAELKLNDGYDSIVSCNKIQTRFWRKEDYGYVPINHNPMKLEQTQDLPIYYEENSLFYILKPENFLLTKTRIGINPYFYPVEFPYNVDIDTEKDWEIVEALNK